MPKVGVGGSDCRGPSGCAERETGKHQREQKLVCSYREASRRPPRRIPPHARSAVRFHPRTGAWPHARLPPKNISREVRRKCGASMGTRHVARRHPVKSDRLMRDLWCEDHSLCGSAIRTFALSQNRGRGATERDPFEPNVISMNRAITFSFSRALRRGWRTWLQRLAYDVASTRGTFDARTPQHRSPPPRPLANSTRSGSRTSRIVDPSWHQRLHQHGKAVQSSGSHRPPPPPPLTTEAVWRRRQFLATVSWARPAPQLHLGPRPASPHGPGDDSTTVRVSAEHVRARTVHTLLLYRASTRLHAASRRMVADNKSTGCHLYPR